MRLLILMALHLHTSKVLSRKYISASDESIENVLIYKDCNRTPKTTTTMSPIRQPLRSPQQPECPFPKMCCSMSCGNDCQDSMSMMGRHISPMSNPQGIQPMSNLPIQPLLPPQPLVQRGRKKKMKAPKSLSIGARRDSGLTKDKIKGLIAQDTDIRKILKDLVRVTMQKVDLLDLINNRRMLSAVTNSEESDRSEEGEDK